MRRLSNQPLFLMNKNEPPFATEALQRSIPYRGMGRKWKIVLAFFLGLILVLILALLALFFMFVVIQ